MASIYVKNKIILYHSKLEKIRGVISPINAAGNLMRDPGKPLFIWYQNTPVGKELFLALYTKKCEWARCSFCTLPSVSSPNMVAPNGILKQTSSAFDSFNPAQLLEIKRVFISNNGSVLNQSTMSLEVLDQICKKAYSQCSSLEIICFETRFNTIKKPILRHYLQKFRKWHSYYRENGARQVKYPVKLQLSAGYETQDPYLRNSVLCKGYPEFLVQKIFKLCSEVYFETDTPILFDENVLLKPAAGMTNDEAIAECVQTIIHLDELGKYFNLPVSIRINPTFVATGSYLHEKFLEKKYTPPSLRDVIKVLLSCQEAKIHIPIFVGLNEENLASPGGSFNNGSLQDSLHKRALQLFNATQDYELLKPYMDGIQKESPEQENEQLI